MLSARKAERVAAAALLGSVPRRRAASGPRAMYLDACTMRLYAAKLVSYAQGFMLMQAAAETEGWALPYGDIALLWRAGCIIRSRFLGDIKNQFFERQPGATQPAAGPVLRRRNKGRRSRLAPGRHRRRRQRCRRAGSGLGAGVLRRLPLRQWFGQHHSGAARFLRGACLSAYRSRRTTHFHTRWLGDGVEEKLP
jgi:6-phosphogluconate dehydrogenase